MKAAVIGAAAALVGALIGAGAAIGAAALNGGFAVTAAAYAPLEARWLEARGLAATLDRQLEDDAMRLARYYGVSVPRPLTPTTTRATILQCTRGTVGTVGPCVMYPARSKSTPRVRQAALPEKSEQLLASLMEREAYADFARAMHRVQALAGRGARSLSQLSARRLVCDMLIAHSALANLVTSENLTDLNTVDTSDPLTSEESGTSSSPTPTETP